MAHTPTTAQEATMFVHRISGRSFTATTGAGSFGSASRDGVWDDGTAGTIFPREELADGARLWIAA